MTSLFATRFASCAIALTIFTLAAFILSGPPAHAAGRCYDVTVKVQQTKPNGKPWDSAKFDGKVTYSAPDIASIINYQHMPRCQDAFSCTYRRLNLTGTTATISILDKDLLMDDTIGFGICKLPVTRRAVTCRVGYASVKLIRCRAIKSKKSPFTPIAYPGRDRTRSHRL